MTRSNEDLQEEKIELLETLITSLQEDAERDRHVQTNMGRTDRRANSSGILFPLILVFVAIQMLLVIVDGLNKLEVNSNKLEDLTVLLKTEARSNVNIIKKIDIIENNVLQNAYRIEDNLIDINHLKDD